MKGRITGQLKTWAWRQEELSFVTIPNYMTLSNFLKQSETHLSHLLKEISRVSDNKCSINTAVTDKFFWLMNIQHTSASRKS